MARKRVGGVKLRTKNADGNYETENGGVCLSTDWEGNYSLIIELDTDEKDDKGYPIRAKLVAGKFQTPGGEVIKRDLSRTFFNLIAWEDMDKRPPRQD